MLRGSVSSGLLAVTLLACAAAEDGGPAAENGAGASGSSGASPSGGSPAAGGSAGGAQGGSAGSGGASGSNGGGAGSAPVGGSAGTAGSSAAGSGAAGGSAGGAAGAGGGANTGSGWTFDDTIEAWAISYADPSSLTDDATLSWDASSGDPSNGSLELVIPFSGVNQKLDVSTALTGEDLSGQVLSAKVRLDSGLGSDAENPGGAKLYVKTGEGYVYADGGWVNLDTAGTWVTLTIDVSTPAGYVAPGTYEPSDVREVGIEIATGGDGTFTSATLHVDTVVY